jgi:hypothetical protein
VACELQSWANKIGAKYQQLTNLYQQMNPQKIDVEIELNELNKSAIKLVGKTIISSEICRQSDDCDDIPYLVLKFSDNTECIISASYSGYTGYSADEYPVMIYVGTITQQ